MYLSLYLKNVVHIQAEFCSPASVLLHSRLKGMCVCILECLHGPFPDITGRLPWLAQYALRVCSCVFFYLQEKGLCG